MSATKEVVVASSKWHERFSRFADRVGGWTGQPLVFVVNVLLIVLWLTSGPFLGFSDKWQLVVNTATTVLTYLMLFVIQNTQNRDSAATHAKLDELLIRIEGPRSELAGIESESGEVIEELRETGDT
jgi:low affinity Fe/Cu permease